MRSLLAFLPAAVPLLGGCTQYGYETVRTDLIPVENIALDLFLIGDAGAPHFPGEPVPDALSGMLRYDRARTGWVYPSDNFWLATVVVDQAGSATGDFPVRIDPAPRATAAP